MKIVFLDAATLGDSSLEMIAAHGQLTCYPSSTPEEAKERVGDCEVLIVNKVRVTRELLAAAPKLRLICEAATGVNNIDLDAAAERSIPVRNVAGYSTDTVVQVTFTHLLSLFSQAPYFDARVKDGSYTKGGLFVDLSRSFAEMKGKTLGIVGMGTIGHKVADIATAFGMEVIYYSTSGTGHCTDFPCVGIEELLRLSDAVSIHAPLNSRTDGLIGAERLRLMKPTAFVINLGRGGIVDEAALAQAVDEGIIAGAGLDVFVREPLPADNPLLNMKHPERMRFSPHMGWASVEARARLVAGIADNIAKGGF